MAAPFPVLATAIDPTASLEQREHAPLVGAATATVTLLTKGPKPTALFWPWGAGTFAGVTEIPNSLTGSLLAREVQLESRGAGSRTKQ
jgi:hypothetical protein